MLKVAKIENVSTATIERQLFNFLERTIGIEIMVIDLLQNRSIDA